MSSVDLKVFSNSRTKAPMHIHPEFWFPDGNIVLHVGSILFKVHRGQLARHSEIFQTLFTVPQPNEHEMVDGCDVMELHDSPSDVLYLLKALYDGLYFHEPRANDFPAIAAVLRLSTKYFIDHLRQHCMARLQLDWPLTLAGWDARERRATDAAGNYNPRELCAHPLLVIDLAREMDLDTLLPSAFYDLCRYAPSKVVSGIPSTPTPTVISGSSRQTLGADDAVNIVRLSRYDIFTSLLGRESAQRFVGSFLESELNVRSIAEDCANREVDFGQCCRESFYFIMLNVLRSVGGIACGRDADPLFTLMQALDMLSRTDFSDGVKQCGLKLCSPCKRDFAEAVKNEREKLWLELPVWFGLQAV